MSADSRVGSEAESSTEREPQGSGKPIAPGFVYRGARWAAARHLSFAWVLTFALGSLFITRGDPTQPRRIVAPVVLLFIYALLGTLEKKKNPLKFADSLYFLGFLWTLVALINAILPGSLDLSLTLKAFGYALLTTAAG